MVDSYWVVPNASVHMLLQEIGSIERNEGERLGIASNITQLIRDCDYSWVSLARPGRYQFRALGIDFRLIYAKGRSFLFDISYLRPYAIFLMQCIEK